MLKGLEPRFIQAKEKLEAPHTDVRLFALHRMRSAAMTDTPRWHCRVHPDLARLIAETPLSADMALTDDGRANCLPRR
jgi:hypothetical protein